MVLGVSMCYDFPGVLNTNIQKEMHVNSFKVNILYSAYSIPNLFMPILTGYLLDYLGLRIGSFILSTIIVIG